MDKVRTSVYLSRAQMDGLKEMARSTGRSRNQLIREGIDLALLRVADTSGPTPRGPDHATS
ncbi:ribbon-helix-helix domain-containing protein [Actinocatenispora comari]|jgi:predicted DNA-binding protein|uniref:Ribbon-helix-helix protein CopG domain-containing protein n=1 Tax=Actinocatenispora comari TaxID=2807577 RepID=A0A8J4A9C4_9ACTN|nr:ribbon-helix-helix domain-containing protein [Actinocatenispora comari]GIL24947.1 hypothetical protein NUM_02020 [Actinocatenispora comari]